MNEVRPRFHVPSRCALYVSGFVSRALAQPRWQRDGFTPSIISSLLSNALLFFQATPKRRRRHFARAPLRWFFFLRVLPFSPPSLPLLTPLPGVFRLVFSFVASPPPPIMGWHLPGPHANMGRVSRMHGVQCSAPRWDAGCCRTCCLSALLLRCCCGSGSVGHLVSFHSRPWVEAPPRSTILVGVTSRITIDVMVDGCREVCAARPGTMSQPTRPGAPKRASGQGRVRAGHGDVCITTFDGSHGVSSSL